MEYGARTIPVYVRTENQWVDRYIGWCIPFRFERTCGHRHVTEEKALICAQTLLNRVRKDSQ